MGKQKRLSVIIYLCCPAVEVCATAQAIFAQLNQFTEEHGFDWTKCKSVASNEEGAMQGSTNGVVRKTKKVSLDFVSTHCMVHCEKLVVKRSIQEKTAFTSGDFLDDVKRL